MTSSPTPPRILAIGAHPDDLELSCGGTLAKYARRGDHVMMAVFTSGNMGDAAIKPDELAQIRHDEAQAAANVIGAELMWVGQEDEAVLNDHAQRRIMIDLLREADPDVIITHSPNDYHPDHRYVSQLVFDSYFQKGLPHIPQQTKPACRFGGTQVYYMDNLGGIDFLPSEYVDVTGTISEKQQMLSCHQSQLRAMQELAKTDIIQMMMTQTRFRGFAAGCAFAEGFRRLDAYQRGLTQRILP